MRLADKENRKIDDKRRIDITNEIKRSKAQYLITLGNEPLINFIKKYNSDIKPLNLALVHLRHAGKLRRYSPDGMKFTQNGRKGLH